MTKLPSVSIIIPTLNRKNILKEALLSVNGIDYPRGKLEVVVVSDGSTDGTEKIIEKVRPDLNYKFKFIKERRRGISHAKNTAIKNSHGEIIVSTDDDCLFEKNWLRKLVLPFKDPHVGSTGGADRPLKRGSIFSVCTNFAFTSFIGSGGIHGRPFPVKLGRFCPMGCNMAIRKDALIRVGLFDEKIAPGEETDLIYRLERAGYRIISVPKVFVWHRAIDNFSGFIRMIFRRGKARVIMIRRHGLASDLIYFLPALLVIFSIGLFLASFHSVLIERIFLGLFTIYLGLLLSAGISAFLSYQNLYCLWAVPVLILAQHFTHGIGFLVGLSELFLKND